MLKKSILFICSFFIVFMGWGLNPDSLWNAAESQSDEQKIETYTLLSDYYLENNQDSVQLVVDALLAIKGNKAAELQSKLITATAAYYEGDNDKAISLSFAGERESAKENFSKLEVSFRHTRALCY